MDTITLLMLAAVITGGAAIFLHVLGKEKHRLESAYKEKRRQIERERSFEQNLRRQNEEARQNVRENAPRIVERMMQGVQPNQAASRPDRRN